jgi:predicted nucleotidyltransferase
MIGVDAHLNEASQYFPYDRIVGIFLQGSQNYGLDYEHSDIDTKLIVTPTFKDIAFNRSPVSTTHVRANEEHIDFKDIRLYIQTFRKQNLNFLEILFTDFKIINDEYENEWMRLVDNREAIAHYNLFQAIKSMKGIALEKYHAMEHAYPSKVDILAKFGYDPKQVSHLVRVEEYIQRYIAGEPYEDCLHPKAAEFIMDIKLGKYNLEEARKIAKSSIEHIENIADEFTQKIENKGNPEVDELLNDVQYNIMKIAIQTEFGQ